MDSKSLIHIATNDFCYPCFVLVFISYTVAEWCIGWTSVSRFWVFRNWGRVGTTIGGDKMEVFHSMQNAIEAFKALYADKTGNLWEDRKHFVKCPRKFYPLDIDYGAVSWLETVDNVVARF